MGEPTPEELKNFFEICRYDNTFSLVRTIGNKKGPFMFGVHYSYQGGGSGNNNSTNLLETMVNLFVNLELNHEFGQNLPIEARVFFPRKCIDRYERDEMETLLKMYARGEQAPLKFSYNYPGLPILCTGLKPEKK